jgi:hypothetical protein
MRKRVRRIVAYIVGILILVSYLIYFNGYRLSAESLNSDLNKSFHFTPSIIVHRESIGGRTLIVSQSNNWLICRSYKSTLSFLWKDEGLTLGPIDLDMELKDKKYSEVMDELVQSCSWLAEETVIMDKTYRILDRNKTQFMEGEQSVQMNLTQEDRRTVVRDGNFFIDQSFTNNDITIHFFYSKTGIAKSIEFEFDESVLEESIITAFSYTTSNQLDDWTFSRLTITKALESYKSSGLWDTKDGSVVISSTTGKISIDFIE